MFNNLTNDQRWLFAAFAFVIASLFITFFLSGQVQVFAYIVIAMLFAGFAILMSSNEDSKKNKPE